MEIVAQIVGIAAMAMGIVSFQGKNRNAILACQLVCSSLFVVHFYLLGVVSGCIINIISMFRAVIYSNREKLKAERIGWALALSCLYAATYVLVFTVFDREPIAINFIVESLPIIGAFVITFSFKNGKTDVIRKATLVGSPLSLIYNIYNKSVGGSCCEALCIISAIIGLIRFDIKKSPKNASEQALDETPNDLQ